MQKLKFIFPLLFMCTLFYSTSANAYQTESYGKQIRVEINKQTNNTLSLNGLYQVTDKATLQKYFVTSKGIVNLAVANNEVTLNHLGTSLKSPIGFNIDALVGTDKVVLFSVDTVGRRSASATATEVVSYNALQGAVFDNTTHTTLSGELWYNVLDSSGVRVWVPAKNTVIESIPSLPLGTIANGKKYRGSFEANKFNTTVQTINRLDVEHYLKGVVASEMPSSWHAEALKSQAIAARGYAIKSNSILSSTTSSQVYGGYNNERASTNAAIDQTKGKVLMYNSKIAETFFYSTSGGRTANVGDVWNSNQSSFPYLVSVDDSTEVSPYSNWTVDIPASSILTRFGYLPINKLLDLKIVKGGANGEVTSVAVVTELGEKTITGNEQIMRGIFKNPAKNNVSLNSNWFDISFIKSPSTLYIQRTGATNLISSVKNYQVQTTSGVQTIESQTATVQTVNGPVSTINNLPNVSSVKVTGKGYGHRIGMSQYGALAKAKGGWNAEQILKHYYPGTTLGNY